MASDRLTVESNEEYDVPSGDTHEYAGATIEGPADSNGTLDVDGTLKLIDDPSPPVQNQQPSGSPISIPLEIDINDMQMGNAVLLTGLMGILLAAVSILKNYAAGIMLMLAFMTLIISALLGIGLEIFWIMVVLTLLLLLVGMVARWAL